MKPRLTHVLAILIAVIAILLVLKFRGRDAAAAESVPNPSQTKRGVSGTANPQDARPPGRHNPRPEREESGNKEIGAADLEKWLAGLKGDTRTIAEAYATVGLLNSDPDLLRKALEMDPDNPLILFHCAARGDFSDEERLVLAGRFLKQDPDNAMAAYLYSARLLGAGDSEKALEILRSATERHLMDDFNDKMGVMFEEALFGAGMSRDRAKLLSISNLSLPYITDFFNLSDSLNKMVKSLPPEEASEIGALTAAMGKRLGGQAESVTLINQIVGLKLEEKTLLGLPDDAPSPYQGLTVAEARESIANERENIKELMKHLPDLETILPGNPELSNGYVDRFRTLGEVEALKWLRQQTGGADK